MNVIIANKEHEKLANIDIDVIKSINGTYDVKEIVTMFKSFFFNKMIIDVTALNNYTNISTYEVLSQGLDTDKIIFLFPDGSSLCTSQFLSKLINMGIYNFTTNIKGVLYLLKKSNSLKDVEHILKMANVEISQETGASVVSLPSTNNNHSLNIIGFKNITQSAGATTLIYMLMKSLLNSGSNVLCMEINKNDFSYFNDKHMISVTQSDIKSFIDKHSDANVILVDLNNSTDTSFCNQILYLVEPSTIKLNKLVRKDSSILKKLSNKKVILNKSLLLNNDVLDLENEAGISVFYNMPPLDERKNNAILNDFLGKLGVLSINNQHSSNKIFGLFRK